MIESARGRRFIVLAVFLWAIIGVVPNFTDLGNQWWPTKNKINYGLDIQGGLHLVLGVDVESIMRKKIVRLASAMELELKDFSVAFKKVFVDPENDQQMVVEYANANDGAALAKHFLDNRGVELQILSQSDTKMLVTYHTATALQYKSQVVGQAIEVIRNRIDEFGVSEPLITAQGNDRILVQLPGVEDSASAKELINKTALLYFRKVSTALTQSEVLEMVAEAEKAGNYSLGKDNLRYLEYVARINKDLAPKLPKNTVVAFERASSAVTLEAGKVAYLMDREGEFTGGLLEDANVGYDPASGSPEVSFRFGVEGRRAFAALTAAAAGGALAIVLDDVIQSAPSVQARIDSDSARITMGGGRSREETYKEASLIATALRAGTLPAALEQLEERTVGPSLGQDAIDKGKLAGIVGAIAVLLFMLFWYRFMGFIANLALLFNLLLILTLLGALGATLTLPGIAGIVLTIGIAVDANVIIFERIKEELNTGMDTLLAIRNGFNAAFSAIVDANVTTVAVCVVLMYFGTGPIKGFAVTLITGVITSMFTSIFVSRTLLEWFVLKLKVKRIV